MRPLEEKLLLEPNWFWTRTHTYARRHAAKLAIRARNMATQRKRLCMLFGRCTEELRTIQRLFDEWDTRAPGPPIGVARRDALVPPTSAWPATRTAARALEGNPAAAKSEVAAKVVDALALIGPEMLYAVDQRVCCSATAQNPSSHSTKSP